MEFKEITREEFWDLKNGPLNCDCHPRMTGKYPYTSEFTTPAGLIVAKIVRSADGKSDLFLVPCK